MMVDRKRPWKEPAGTAIYVASNFTAQRSNGCVAPFPRTFFKWLALGEGRTLGGKDRPYLSGYNPTTTTYFIHVYSRVS
jgi:hypothetical protein